jgi:hypothetical protein
MSMHWDLQLKMPLQSTVSSVGFLPAAKIKKSKDPSNTIKDEMEWKRVFYLLCANYSDLLVLRLTDSNVTGLDKLYYFVRRTTESIKESVSVLGNEVDINPSPPPIQILSDGGPPASGPTCKHVCAGAHTCTPVCASDVRAARFPLSQQGGTYSKGYTST